MQCRNCGTEIAEKALICYRCGTATTEAKFKPVDIGKARRSRTTLWIVVAVILALLVLAAFLLIDSGSPDLKGGPAQSLEPRAWAYMLARPEGRAYGDL